MYLEKVVLENIKKYVGVNEFLFSNEALINTISGRNGSGKSTIFESIILCQKAYFTNLEEPADVYILDNPLNGRKSLRDIVMNELALMSSSGAAKISVTLGFTKEELIRSEKFEEIIEDKYSVEVILTGTEIDGEHCEWTVDTLDESGLDIIEKFWNLSNPQNIIMLLDADKNVYENDFSYEKISMLSNNKRSPIIDFVLDSKSVYQNMYDIMMKAYVYQRVNPQTPRKDDFFVNSKEMFKQIIDNVEISNFSGKYIDNQFIVVAKNPKQYDARHLSSGEKLVWYVLLILNYVKEIGLLIIDEPENHLHEQLAWKFIYYLKSLVDSESKEIKIGEIFLITHAKNLIYNNFAIGKNYIISEDRLEVIDQASCEKVLRECGISFTEDKILFVEGDTETDHLTSLCAESNIKIKQLANCAELIQVYKNLIKVKELVYVPKFVFMIDRDTREDVEISNLMHLDQDFYDNHMVFLPVHEIENFLLDENIIAECLNVYLSDFSSDVVDASEVYEKMKEFADEKVDSTRKKFINNELHEIIKSMSQLVRQREIKIGSQDEYTNYVEGLFSENNMQMYLDKMKAKYSQMQNKYGEDNWNGHWKELCDGKMVLDRICKDFGNRYTMNEKALKEKVFRKILLNESTEFHTFWNLLLSKYQ